LYHIKSQVIRELLFKIGEKNLILHKIPDWYKLKENHKFGVCKDYDSPFSFLSKLGNPIAAVNNHRDEVGAAIHISLQFIEYLGYKYKGISKL
jgi:hypothetical protein